VSRGGKRGAMALGGGRERHFLWFLSSPLQIERREETKKPGPVYFLRRETRVNRIHEFTINHHKSVSDGLQS
jgi:hypothetical protein